VPYVPHTREDVARLLQAVGVTDVEALLTSIPQALRRKTPLEVPAGLDEVSLAAHLEALAARSTGAKLSFLGGGAYDHAVHPVVDQLLARSEFLTPYTPYQPEASQGTLQAVFEFQTMIAELFGLEVANASLYDGASAVAEAALMARRLAKRERILLSAALPPQVRRTVRTYTMGAAPDLVEEVPYDRATGAVDLGALKAKLGPDVGAVVLGYPNYLGVPEDLDAAAHLCCDAGAYLVSHTPDPFVLGILRSPGAANVAVAVGEGQPLGLPLSFGGPGVGLMAARAEFVRQMPGRLVGETVDTRGQRAFVLTLSTREQHIRREKATSNICSNQGLCALGVTIHLSLIGPQGFRRIAETCHERARHLAATLGRIPGLRLAFASPYAHEFAIRHESGTKLVKAAGALERDGILLGVPLGPDYPELDGAYLLAVTERTQPADIDRLAEALRRALA
jgi:glycine dehydrogenase subunit 1